MTEANAVELTENRVPFAGIEDAIDELVEMYGGEVTARREGARDFLLPLRRGVASSGAVECTVSWAPDDERDATVRMVTNRNVDAPKTQRVLLLLAGVIGSVMFMLWPFFPGERAFGGLAWIGGIIAIAVYMMTLRKSSGGIAYDFLQRLAARQRNSLSS
ncbi:MAG TPA: hypothetical protein VGQ36_02730 [Thermoanaerobaculia bacterium]|jgi:hypothetical protein|nr:hypothetical protein [Thermoanaerobaculia bacterium]